MNDIAAPIALSTPTLQKLHLRNAISQVVYDFIYAINYHCAGFEKYQIHIVFVDSVFYHGSK